ncbi:MAG: hypothetical protein ACI4XL_02485 [Bacillus sp. (in: firmicutes)]
MGQSVYIHLETRAVHIDKEKALKYYAFTENELTSVQNKLASLTDIQIQEMVNYALAGSDGAIQPQVVLVIVWGGIAVIVISIGMMIYTTIKR